MNKKGFTMVELLSTIFVLGIVLAIAISSTIGIYKSIKQKALEEKIAIIEESAILFGENRKENIIKSTSVYKDVPCKSFKLRELVPKYIENDTDNECINSENGNEIGCIIDPSDKNNYLDETEVIVYYQNKRIYSVVDINDELECEMTKFTPVVKEFYIEDGNTFVVNHTNVNVTLTWDVENIKYYCINDRDNYESCIWNEATNKSVTTEYTLSPSDGKKELYAFIKDKYENLSEGKKTEITLDTTPPTNNSVKINGDNEYTNSRSVTLTLSSSGAKEMCISNTESCSNWEEYATSKSWTLTSGEGTKTVYVWYKDELGNATQNYVTDTIIIDTSAPTNNSVKINNDAEYTTSTSVTLTLSSSGAKEMCISNTSSCSSWEPYKTSKAHTLSTGDGTKTVYVWYKDEAGNATSNYVTDTIYLDATAPTNNSVKINNNDTYVKGTSVTLTLSSSGATEMCISNTSSCSSWEPYKTSKTHTLSTGEGTKTVYVWYKDEYGNVSQYVTDTIIYDVTAPTNNSIRINSNASYTTSTSVTLTLSSNGASQMCISNTSSCTNWITYTTSKSHTLTSGDGTKTVYAWFKDGAGNTTSYVTDTIILDTAYPTVTASAVSNNTSSPKISITSSETGTYCVNTSSSRTNMSNCTKTGNVTANSAIQTNAFTTGGTYYVHVKDAAGNIGISSSVSIIKATLFGTYIRSVQPTGLNTSMQGGLYRFRGETANNYVCFGTSTKSTCTGTPDRYMYRIIGINSDGQVKLIKKEALNSKIEWYWNDAYEYGWPDSEIYDEINGSSFLNNTTYVPSAWSSKIATIAWKYGDLSSHDPSYSSSSLYEEENAWTDTVSAKIAIMYMHDYSYAAATISNCNLQPSVCKSSWIHLSNNDSSAPDTKEWLMAHVPLRDGYSINGFHTARIIGESGAHESKSIEVELSVRPVFYLVTSVNYVSGTGTASDPFIIS